MVVRGLLSNDMKSSSPRFGALMRLALFACAVALCSAFFMQADPAYAATSSQLAGVNRYETAVKQASEAYPDGCPTAIVVNSDAWADSLSATGLAGALDCPILFCSASKLPSVTSAALGDLGVSEIVVIGGEGAVSEDVKNALGSIEGVSSVTRVSGADRYETQMKIYEFGKSGYDGVDHWSHDLLIVATGSSFADALSVSPVAVAKAAPIFLVDSSGQLSEIQEEAILSDGYLNAAVVGGTSVVSGETYGYLEAVTFAQKGSSGAVRIGGANRYETSKLIAQWAVGSGYLKWDGLAFASGSKPYDALAGSVLQGKKGSVLLLVGDARSATIDAAAKKAGSVSKYVYFGGTGAVSSALREYIQLSFDAGKALPMGTSKLSDGSYVQCDASGVVKKLGATYAAYINKANGYSSLTNYLILVDTVANKTIVFTGSRGSWSIEKEYACTTGAPSSPTKKGVFTVGLRGKSFGSGYTCWYWTQFSGNYLFHSVLYQPGSMTQIQDGRLGINASHGCVRLAINDAKWIYDNIPSKSKVVVY